MIRCEKFSIQVREVLERLLERQFLLSPWVREKRLRNQLRLILKVVHHAQTHCGHQCALLQDHLEAGPMRRSTVTKIVHDAHQVFPVWRNQIREVVSARRKERTSSKTAGQQEKVNWEYEQEEGLERKEEKDLHFTWA